MLLVYECRWFENLGDETLYCLRRMHMEYELALLLKVFSFVQNKIPDIIYQYSMV